MVLGGQLFGPAGQREALSKLRTYVADGVEKLMTVEMEGRVKQPLLPAQAWIDPHTLFLRNSIWYVDAHDLEKRETRTFRLSRIQQFEALPLGQVGQYQQTQGFHPWDFGKLPAVTARLRLTPRLRAWLLENPAHPSQQWTGEKVSYEVKDRQAFVRWFLGR